MDMDCKYINKKNGECNSYLKKKREYSTICFSSDYKKCLSFPMEELKEIIKPEKESSLEKEAKE